MTEQDETDRLLAGVSMADRRAFEALYEATAAQVYGLLLGETDDPSRAERLLQDVFEQVWSDAGLYQDGERSARTWLLELAAQHLGRDALPQTVTDQAPPPQVYPRLEVALWGRRSLAVWGEVRPYLLGAVVAGLLAAAAVATGLVPLQAVGVGLVDQ